MNNLAPVPAGTRIVVISADGYTRIENDISINLCGTQGTVLETESTYFIGRRTFSSIRMAVTGYKIKLQTGETAIIQRPDFIPLNDPPKEEQKETEQCLDAPALCV